MNKSKTIFFLTFVCLLLYTNNSNLSYASTIDKDTPGKITVGTDEYNKSSSSKPDHKKAKGSSSHKTRHSKPQRSEWDQMIDNEVSNAISEFNKIKGKYNDGISSYGSSDFVTLIYDPGEPGRITTKNDRIIGFHWIVKKIDTGKIVYNESKEDLDFRYTTFEATYGEYLATRYEIRQADEVRETTAILQTMNEDGNISSREVVVDSTVVGHTSPKDKNPVHFKIKVTPKDCPPNSPLCPVPIPPKVSTTISTIDHLVE